jgi:chromosomal replication initiation ATPase DnaA
MTYLIYPGLQSTDEIICRWFQIPNEKIRQHTRDREVVDARRFAMLYSRDYCGQQGNTPTLEQIGAMYGLHHATVLHNVNSCRQLIRNDRQFRHRAVNAMRDLCPEIKNFL